MCSPELVMMSTGVALSAYGTYNAAQSERAGLKYEANVADLNRIYSEMSARDALALGEEQVAKISRQTRQLKGAQRAAYGASNIRLTEGSPLAVLADTDILSAMDIATTRENAKREATGFLRQGRNYSRRGLLLNAQRSGIMPGVETATTLLTGAGNVASKWYDWNRTKR